MTVVCIKLVITLVITIICSYAHEERYWERVSRPFLCIPLSSQEHHILWDFYED